jgi:DNA modification methylase
MTVGVGAEMVPNSVIYGDCLQSLSQLPDACVQTCVTSPPYWGQRDYGSYSWIGGRVECDHEHHAVEDRSVWKRVADGTLIPSRSCRRCAAWLGQVGLEPTIEQFVEHLVTVFGAVRRVLRDNGSLWLNMGDTYNAYGNRGPSKGFSRHADSARPTWAGGGLMCPRVPNKSLLGLPWRVALALCDDGWSLRADITWRKPCPTPERVKDRPPRCTERLFLFAKSDDYFYVRDALKRYGESEQGDVWTIATRSYAGAHFAVFPPELPERCILASTRPSDLVLDPFAGSGTTLAVAKSLGRSFVGVEANEEYRPLIEARLADVMPPARLASDDALSPVLASIDAAKRAS